MSPVLLGRVSGSQAFASLASLRRVSREVFEPTYVDDVFSTTLYTSNASSTGDGTEQVITTGIDHTEGFLTWIKNRDDAIDHVLFDSERIGTNYKWLYSNSSSAEQDTANIFKSPTSTGFTVRQDTSGSGVGRTNPIGAKDMCSWTFRKAPGFFDIVTYTGDAAAPNPGVGRTISHNLGSVPGMIFIKDIGRNQNWRVYHRSNGAEYSFFLNGNNGNALRYDDDRAFNDTEPTSTEFTVGTDSDVNTFGQNYIAYLFAHDDQSFGTNSDEAIIKCGSYTGNGSTTGPVIDLGFEPQFIMVKVSEDADGATGPWIIQDAMRNGEVTSNVTNGIYANTDGAESTTQPNLGVTATGFQPRSTSNYINKNGNTYVYMAIRRPHKPPEAGTDVFALDATSASGSTGNAFDAPFPVDMVLEQRWGSGDNKYIAARLASGKYMLTNTTGNEVTSSSVTFDSMDGVFTAFSNTDYSAQMFKRAPGFFDVVAYTGTGSTRTLSHNLGAVPELIIVKNRLRDPSSWFVQDGINGATNYLQIHTTNGTIQNSAVWNDTEPTSSVFTVSSNGVNRSGDSFIAYLFASLDGISKVGSYSGTGSNINVDCGFTAGARFVLIKQSEPAGTGSSGDWYVWDTAHGIVSGNDPYILLNDSNAQVTNTDYIDPLNAGFTVTSSAPAALNASGGTYIFLAIA